MIMNDGGYGVMRGIQNNYFGGRQYFNELHTPDYQKLGESMGVKAGKFLVLMNLKLQSNKPLSLKDQP